MTKNLATLQSRYSLVEQDKKVPPKASMIGGELGQVVVQHFVFTPIWNQLVGPIFTIREMGPMYLEGSHLSLTDLVFLSLYL